MAAAKTLPEILHDKRQEALEALARVPDNDPAKGTRLKGRIEALDDILQTVKDMARANRDPVDNDKD